MTHLDANADLLRRQREIVDRKTLKKFTKRRDLPVSYTHLTLPTIYSV